MRGERELELSVSGADPAPYGRETLPEADGLATSAVAGAAVGAVAHALTLFETKISLKASGIDVGGATALGGFNLSILAEFNRHTAAFDGGPALSVVEISTA